MCHLQLSQKRDINIIAVNEINTAALEEGGNNKKYVKMVIY